MVTQLLLYFKHIWTPEFLPQKTEHISQNITLFCTQPTVTLLLHFLYYLLPNFIKENGFHYQ
jgi:hypothetical protein